MSAAPAFVVMWRARPGEAWFVQPHVHNEFSAAAIRRRLLDNSAGQVIAVPVEIPPDGLVTRDLDYRASEMRDSPKGPGE